MKKEYLLYLLAYPRKAQIFIFCVNGELLSNKGFFHKSISEICNKMLIVALQIPVLLLLTDINILQNITSLLKLK